MSDKTLRVMLERLGFTAYEAEIYLLCAKHGAVTTGPLINESGLHRNVVYTALEHLVSRKLVTERQIRGKKTFAISDPHRLAQEFSDKAQVARDAAEDISKLSVGLAQEISVHEGNEEYLSLLTGLIKQLPKGGTKYVLGTGGESFMKSTMRTIWRKYHKVAKEQGIHIKMLAYESQRDALSKDIENESMYEVRYLPDNIENPAGVHIYPEANTVLNIIYSDDQVPVTAIRIRDQRLVDGQLNLFRNLWKIAKV